MEEHREGVAFPPTVMGTAEGQMVRADLVREIVARRERGEGAKADRARGATPFRWTVWGLRLDCLFAESFRS